MIISITGTPGCGKSWVSKIISEKLGFKICDNNCITSFDPSIIDEIQNNEKIIDVDKLNLAFKRYIKSEKVRENQEKPLKIIFDSLLSHEVSKEIVDLCIIVKAPLSEIKKRLIKRGYSDEKIDENLESEILDVCGQDAIENGHNIIYFFNSVDDKDKKLMEENFKPNISNIDDLILFIKKQI